MRRILSEKKNLLLLAWPIGIAIYAVAGSSTDLAEHFFARGLYAAYASGVSRLTGLCSFSIAEVIVIILPLVILQKLVRDIVRIARHHDTSVGQDGIATGVLRIVRNLLILLGVIMLWYMIGCGTNYYRYTFTEYCGLKIEKSTTEELYDLCNELMHKASDARSDFGHGVYASPYTDVELAREAKLAMEKLGERYEVLGGDYPCPKPVHFSKVMSEFNITGVYFPWTVEANANVDIPDYSVASTMCHELVHVRGFMREDEANYIAYLACKDSDCAELRYSGYMHAFIHAINALYAADPELAQEVVYDADVYSDLYVNSLYWDQYKDTTLSEIGEKANDSYLKANGQTDGTRSYGRMVDLLLAEFRAEHAYE